MPAITVTVSQPEGLHARPAAEFVKLANRFTTGIRVKHGAREANGKSIMSVLTLGANCGAQVEITADGPDADDALRTLAGFLQGGSPS